MVEALLGLIGAVLYLEVTNNVIKNAKVRIITKILFLAAVLSYFALYFNVFQLF